MLMSIPIISPIEIRVGEPVAVADGAARVLEIDAEGLGILHPSTDLFEEIFSEAKL